MAMIQFANMTEMTKWLTASFALQFQSLTNHISDGDYSNHQLEDVVLMFQQIIRTLMTREMKDS